MNASNSYFELVFRFKADRSIVARYETFSQAMESAETRNRLIRKGMVSAVAQVVDGEEVGRAKVAK